MTKSIANSEINSLKILRTLHFNILSIKRIKGFSQIPDPAQKGHFRPVTYLKSCT